MRRVSVGILQYQGLVQGCLVFAPTLFPKLILTELMQFKSFRFRFQVVWSFRSGFRV